MEIVVILTVLISFGILLVILIQLHYNDASHLEDKRKLATWQALVEFNTGLVYVPSGPLSRQETYVVGYYNRFHLKLETFFHQSDELNNKNLKTLKKYTRIILSLDNSNNRIFTDDDDIRLEINSSQDLLDHLILNEAQYITGITFAGINGHQVIYEQEGIETDLDYLQSLRRFGNS